MLVKVLFLICLNFFDHGGLHEAIQRVNKDICAHPEDGELYFRRANLYFQHEVYDSCVADILTAHRLEFESGLSYVVLAKSYLNLDAPQKALKAIRQGIEKGTVPDILSAGVLGDIYYYTGHYVEAAKAYQKVFEKAIRKRPIHFLHLARAYEKSGIDGIQKAKNIFEQGIEAYGYEGAVFSEYIDFLVRVSDFDTALKLLKSVAESRKRKEFIYFRLARIYRSVGKESLALKYADLCHRSIDKLPPNHRKTKVIFSLLRDLEDFRKTK